MGYGDDFALYRGLLDTRFLLLPYDMDSVLGQGRRTTTYGDGIFRMFGSETMQFQPCSASSNIPVCSITIVN